MTNVNIDNIEQDFEKLEQELEKHKEDQESLIKEIDNLQKEKEKLELELKKERLLFTIFIIILLDIFFFKEYEDWGGALVVGFLEVLAILFAAHHWGLEQVIAIYRDILSIFRKREN